MIITYEKKQRISVGLVLSICGVSVGGLIKLALGVNYSWLSAAIILLSILFLVDVSRIHLYRKMTCLVVAIYMYSAYTLCLACLNSTAFFGSNISIFYQLVYFIQIILIWGLRDRYDTEDFQKKAFWILGMSSLFAIYLLFAKQIGVGYGILLESTDDTNAVSRATTGFVGYYSLCASLVFRPHGRIERFSKAFFMLSSLCVIVLSARRSIFIALAIVTILRFIHNFDAKRVDLWKVLKRLLIVFLSLFVIIVLLRTNNTVSKALDRAWNSIVNGIRTYVGIDYSDRSAGYRRARIESIPNEYMNKSSFSQIVFGRGYNTDWLDVPFLQAFWDMGLLGGIWYFIIQGIIPIFHVFRKPNNAAVEFAQYCVVLRIIQNFSNGTPYGTFLPLILLYVFEYAGKNSLIDHHDQEE